MSTWTHACGLMWKKHLYCCRQVQTSHGGALGPKPSGCCPCKQREAWTHRECRVTAGADSQRAVSTIWGALRFARKHESPEGAKEGSSPTAFAKGTILGTAGFQLALPEPGEREISSKLPPVCGNLFQQAQERNTNTTKFRFFRLQRERLIPDARGQDHCVVTHGPLSSLLRWKVRHHSLIKMPCPDIVSLMGDSHLQVPSI